MHRRRIAQLRRRYPRKAGQCVADASLSCGDGTHADAGRCVADASLSCGTGTHQDGEACLPDAVCGAGTHQSDDTCVADDMEPEATPGVMAVYDAFGGILIYAANAPVDAEPVRHLTGDWVAEVGDANWPIMDWNWAMMACVPQLCAKAAPASGVATAAGRGSTAVGCGWASGTAELDVGVGIDVVDGAAAIASTAVAGVMRPADTSATGWWIGSFGS